MPRLEPTDEKLIRLLQETVARLRSDLVCLEIAVAAFGAFKQPIPGHDWSNGKFALPRRRTGS